jgi:hypothetical protein
MATIDLILQNLNDRDEHLKFVKQLLSWGDASNFVFSLAYVTHGGARRILPELNLVGTRCVVYAGIRNGTTSEFGLRTLLEAGVEVYGIDGGLDLGSIFHPKFYLGFNDTSARVILGSVNLTEGGLVRNVEASTSIALELSDPADHATLAKLLDALAFLKEQRPGNVHPIKTTEDIRRLVEHGLLEADDGRPARDEERETGTDTGPSVASLYQRKAHEDEGGGEPGERQGGCRQPPEGYLAYFTSLLADARVQAAYGGRTQKPAHRNRQTVKVVNGVGYCACFEKDGTIMAEVSLPKEKRNNVKLFERLHERRAEMESHFEGDFSWTQRYSTDGRFFVVSQPYPEEESIAEREAIREWHIQTLVTLRRIVGDMIDGIESVIEH